MSKAGYHIFLFHAIDVSLCQIILMDYLVLVKQAKKNMTPFDIFLFFNYHPSNKIYLSSR